MILNTNDPEKTKLEFKIKEEHRIRYILLSELEDLYFFWKFCFIFKKIKTYLLEKDKLRYKINSLFQNVFRKIKQESMPFPDTFSNAYKNKLVKYIFLLDKKHNRKKDLDKVEKIFRENSEKKIVVYPQTVYWEPLQRPQQLLKQLGKKGYLCLFCEPEKNKLRIRQVAENVFLISGERYLVYPLKNKQVIVLCTWMLNLPFINLLDEKIIWYDLIDRLELFSLYDEDMLKHHNQVVLGADLVTYSGLELKKLVASRVDSVYLPNGVVFEDFNMPTVDARNITGKARVTFTSMKRPIVGFYGSIAEWLDFELIKGLAELRTDWNFVYIGKIWTNVDLIKEIPNIYLLGLVPYQDLPFYAKKFDVAIIPFVINQITNSVSPIKLFEYAALGKPVVATPFREITQYQDQSFIRLAETAEEFAEKIEIFLEKLPKNLEEEAKLFAQKNHWEERIKLIENNLNL